MKSATLPPLRVDPELRRAAEEVLEAGESLSGFIEQSVRSEIEYRLARRAFVERGLRAGETARADGSHVEAGAVLGRLEQMLADAQAKRSAG